MLLLRNSHKTIIHYFIISNNSNINVYFGKYIDQGCNFRILLDKKKIIHQSHYRKTETFRFKNDRCGEGVALLCEGGECTSSMSSLQIYCIPNYIEVLNFNLEEYRFL